jgi:hypothetical protein
MPRSVDGPWDWPPVVRVDRLRPPGAAALTVAPAWGLSAGPSHSGAFGRGGAWAAEAEEIERRYGPDATIHVSLEEFARTLTPSAENRERFREGGVRARGIGHRLSESRSSGELERLRTAFVRYRAFDRANVLHLFTTLHRNAAFARAFPAAVQTGPLWPGRRARHRPRSVREWVWYASPASAESIAAEVEAGLREAADPPHLLLRTDRRWTAPRVTPAVERVEGPMPSKAWQRRFAAADLRIVTGSRTLLEAMELGGPFLYFNGTLAEGSARRRHRPEKLRELLAALRLRSAPPDLVLDLAEFGRGRRVRSIIRRAADRTGGWARFPRRIGPSGFPPPYDDAGRLMVAVGRALGRAQASSPDLVARVRSGRPL